VQIASAKLYFLFSVSINFAHSTIFHDHWSYTIL